MSEYGELMDLISKLPESQIQTARSFLKFLLEKYALDAGKNDFDSTDEKTNRARITLQGITSGSSVSDADLEEAKRIWQSL